MLPDEIINYIYIFNVDHRILFKLCMQELEQKIVRKKVNSIIVLLKYGPIYASAKYLVKNINIYPILNKLRSNYI